MRWNERFSLLLKVIIPLLFLIVLQVSPVSDAVASHLRAAQTAQEQGQPATMAEALRQVVLREPWRTALWERIGRAELEAGQPEQAIEALRKAEQAGVLSSEGRYRLGDAYLQQGDDRTAETAWRKQLKTDGPSEQVYARLAQLLRARHDTAGAIEVLRDWHAFAPQNPQVAYQLGLLLSTVQPDEALPLLLEASKKDSQYTSAVQSLRAGLGQASSAKEPAYGWLMIGRALGNIGQWDLALEAFQRSTSASPAYAEAWAFIGEARYHVDGSGKADLDRANQLNAESPVVRALLGLYWRRQGQPDKALPYVEAIVKQEPAEAAWQVELGNTLVETGDLPAAQEAFQKAVDLEPKNSMLWQYLALFSAENNVAVHDLGLPAARQAVLLAPNDPAALDTLGLVLTYLGDFATSERFLQQALEKDATYAPACLHLGQLYLQQQDANQAYSYLKRALDLAGEDQVGQTAKRLLKRYYGEGG